LAELGDYLDNEVASELRAHLEQHLASCKTCTVLVDSTRMTMKIVTESGSFDVPDESLRPITGQIMAKIRSL
jgi:anti-sigma factor RsiW